MAMQVQKSGINQALAMSWLPTAKPTWRSRVLSIDICAAAMTSLIPHLLSAAELALTPARASRVRREFQGAASRPRRIAQLPS